MTLPRFEPGTQRYKSERVTTTQTCSVWMRAYNYDRSLTNRLWRLKVAQRMHSNGQLLRTWQ